jgi:hypothetical protein
VKHHLSNLGKQKSGIRQHPGEQGSRATTNPQRAASAPTQPHTADLQAVLMGLQQGAAPVLPPEADFFVKMFSQRPWEADGWLVKSFPTTIPRQSMPSLLVLSNQGKCSEKAPPAPQFPRRRVQESLLDHSLVGTAFRQFVATTISLLPRGNIPGFGVAPTASWLPCEQTRRATGAEYCWTCDAPDSD